MAGSARRQAEGQKHREPAFLLFFLSSNPHLRFG
jgi:hypothetical protein